MRSGSGVEWGEDTLIGGKSPKSITLTMRQGPNPGQRFTVRKDNVTVGRLPDNDVSIADQQVSRHHANITWENGQFFIRDMGSANGTMVNGTLITGPCPLRDGDVIAFGEVVLTFQGSAIIPDTSDDVFGPPERVPITTPIPLAETPTGTAWPVLIGIGLALFFALLVIAAVLVFAVSQTQSVPEIKVQQPLNGFEARTGQPVLILASATDRKGIDRVELWVDGALNTTLSSSQPGGQPILLVQQPWTPTSGGVHTLSLRAYNSAGKPGEPFNIVVNITDSGSPQAPVSTSTPTTTSIVQPTPVAMDTPVPTPTPSPPPCTNDSAFVTDVTVPDNTVFHPGERIDKTWRIRNSGDCPWDSAYRLAFVSGNKMGAPDNQPVVPTAPGGTTDVTVTMYAPTSPGIYKGIWRMVNVNGESFGESFTVVIQVPSPYTPTPVVTATFTPMPGPLVNLTVDRDRVNAGECTTLHASVEGVSAAWLDGEAIVGGYKEKSVCPCGETTYTLDAALSNGEHVYRSVKIGVDGTCVVNKPDLVIRELETDATSPQIGQKTYFRVRIKNQGNAKARDFAVAWKPFGADSSTVLVLKEHLNLEAGQDQWIDWHYTYNDEGPFDSQAIVDYHDSVDETNEKNNTKTLEISPHS